MKLKRLIPMLNVSHIENSLEFYQRGLGFSIVSDPAAVADWRWANIRSGDAELMLSESGGSPALKQNIDPHLDTSWPCIYYFYPDDVDAMHAHLCDQGYSPSALQTTLYDMREFSIQDPDGHLLSFGQDAEQ